jgi:hypothetical protein
VCLLDFCSFLVDQKIVQLCFVPWLLKTESFFVTQKGSRRAGEPSLLSCDFLGESCLPAIVGVAQTLKTIYSSKYWSTYAVFLEPKKVRMLHGSDGVDAFVVEDGVLCCGMCFCAV